MIVIAALAIIIVSAADLSALHNLQNQASDERDAFSLHVLHTQAQQAVLNEAVVYWKVHEGIADTASLEQAHAERVFVAAQLQPDLQRLGDGNGVTAALARDLSSILGRLPDQPNYSSPFVVQSSLVGPMESLSDRFERQAERGRSAGALIQLAGSPLVNAGVVVRAPRSAGSVGSSSAMSLVSLVDAGSWSADPSQPFSQPGVNRLAIEYGLPNVSAALTGVETWPATQALHEVDLWLQGLQASAIEGTDWAPPPALVAGDLSEFFDLSVGLSGTIHRLAVDTFEDQIQANSDVLQQVDGRTTGSLAVTGIAGMVLLAALVRLWLVLRERSDELRSLAATDALTGLGNRFVLQQMARKQLAGNGEHGLIHVDLDRFKQINDTFGHQAGDAVLVEVARRIRYTVASHGQAFRTGGDEFVVLCRAPADVIETLAEDIRLSLASRPVASGDLALAVTASIGAVARTGSVDYQDLMTDADLATYRAKVGTRNQAVFVDDNSSLSLVKRLDEAVANGEIVAWFQPEVAAGTGEVCNVECLARWVSPSGKVVPSAEWIWTVEWMGATDLILGAVVRSIGRAQRDVPEFVGRYFINMDARLLAGPGKADEILELLASEGVDPSRTGIDVIGDIASQPLDQLTASVRDLRDAGINIALDDFGAMSAPLGILASLPVDTIKIDRSLVVDAHKDPRKRALLQTAVATARALSADVLAEGIETIDELTVVQDLGVDYVTGQLTGLATPNPQLEIANFPTRTPETADVTPGV